MLLQIKRQIIIAYNSLLKMLSISVYGKSHGIGDKIRECICRLPILIALHIQKTFK